jgi:hypothetical protein
MKIGGLIAMAALAAGVSAFALWQVHGMAPVTTRPSPTAESYQPVGGGLLPPTVQAGPAVAAVPPLPKVRWRYDKVSIAGHDELPPIAGMTPEEAAKLRALSPPVAKGGKKHKHHHEHHHGADHQHRQARSAR